MAIIEHMRGRVRVICDISGCGYMSHVYKDEEGTPDMSGATAETQAHHDLAFHNFRNHPGVFPRWNPGVEAVERERRNRAPG